MAGRNLHPLLKGLLMFLVFAGTAVLFWQHYENSLTKIQNKQSLWDQTKTLTPAQKEIIYQYGQFLRKNYGYKLIIKITNERVYLPRLDKRTIFIGLSPRHYQVFVTLPPILEKALGVQFVHYLQTEYFKDYFAQDKWPQRLLNCLKLIQKRIEQIAG